MTHADHNKQIRRRLHTDCVKNYELLKSEMEHYSYCFSADQKRCITRLMKNLKECATATADRRDFHLD